MDEFWTQNKAQLQHSIANRVTEYCSNIVRCESADAERQNERLRGEIQALQRQNDQFMQMHMTMTMSNNSNVVPLEAVTASTSTAMGTAVVNAEGTNTNVKAEAIEIVDSDDDGPPNVDDAMNSTVSVDTDQNEGNEGDVSSSQIELAENQPVDANNDIENGDALSVVSEAPTESTAVLEHNDIAFDETISEQSPMSMDDTTDSASMAEVMVTQSTSRNVDAGTSAIANSKELYIWNVANSIVKIVFVFVFV